MSSLGREPEPGGSKRQGAPKERGGPAIACLAHENANFYQRRESANGLFKAGAIKESLRGR